MLVTRSALALAAAIACAHPAVAEGPASVEQPDIAALRYYAARGEQGRVEAEIQRLKTLYPSWQQPQNLFEDGSAEEAGLWTLFAQGSVDAIDAELGRLKIEAPDFEPSDVFLTKFAGLKQRAVILEAWAAKDWSRVVALLDGNAGVATQGDVQLIWALVDAHVALEHFDAAQEAIRAAYGASDSPQERATTLEKAAQLLPLATVRTIAGGDFASDPVIAAAVVRGALVRNAKLGLDLPEELKPALAAYEATIEATPNREAVRLLAWWRFGTRDFARANRWFAKAMTMEPDVELAEGATMSALRAGDSARAEALLNTWQDRSPAMEALSISAQAPRLLARDGPAVAASFLEGFAGRTARLKSGEGAEALGWFAYEHKQDTAAAAWFDRALLWRPTDTAAYGRALTAMRAKDRATFDRMKAEHGDDASIARLTFAAAPPPASAKSTTRSTRSVADGLRAQIVREHGAKRYAKCLTLTDRLGTALTASDREMRGWCLLGVSRFAEAERAFARVVQAGGANRVTAAYGQTLAALGGGKTNEAQAIADAHPLTATQRRTVDIELLTQRARAAFDHRDYRSSLRALDLRAQMTPEPGDLAAMRGWSHFHSGDPKGAERVFARLDAQLSTRDTRRGLAAAIGAIRSGIQNDR